MKKYDVAVIGLGAVGSAALYQLSKTGLNVIGIDRYDPPHSHGSSFGETRLTRQALFEGSEYTPMVLRANQIWAELEAATGEELYNKCGMLLAGYEDQHFFQNTVKAANEHAITHEILEPAEVEKRFPAIKAMDSNLAYYYEPGAGFLRPEKCIEVQLKLARDNGAKTLTNTKVISIREDADGAHVDIQGGDTITADKIIVATGPWISELLPDTLGHILKTYLHTLYWFDIEQTHLPELLPSAMPVFLCGVEKSETAKSFYGFPAIHGATGGMKFAFGESELEASADHKDTIDRGLEYPKELYSYVSKHIKHLKPEVIRSFGCLYTETPDFNFIIDYVPNNKRIIIGSACSGHGFKHSAATGEVLAQVATGVSQAINIDGFRLNRFTKHD